MTSLGQRCALLRMHYGHWRGWQKSGSTPQGADTGSNPALPVGLDQCLQARILYYIAVLVTEKDRIWSDFAGVLQRALHLSMVFRKVVASDLVPVSVQQVDRRTEPGIKE